MKLNCFVLLNLCLCRVYNHCFCFKNRIDTYERFNVSECYDGIIIIWYLQYDVNQYVYTVSGYNYMMLVACLCYVVYILAISITLSVHLR